MNVIYIFVSDDSYLLRVVSLGTGSKCLSKSKMSKEGKVTVNSEIFTRFLFRNI